VGVNRFQTDASDTVEIVKIGPKHQGRAGRRLRRLRAERDGVLVERCWTGAKRPGAA